MTKTIRGKGIDSDEIDDLVDKHALSCDEWPRGEFFLVTDERKDDTDLRDGKVFGKLAHATKYAQACGHGNVNQRVLRCTTEIIVIATDNKP